MYSLLHGHGVLGRVAVAEERLVERLDAHRLLRLHVALAHGRRRDGVASESIHKLLVVDVPVAVAIAREDELIELGVFNRDVPQVERTGDLVLVERAERSMSTYWKALNMSLKRLFIASDAILVN